MTQSFNIVFFGETGSGKSSIINLIAGHEVTKVSGGALGCTFSSSRYDVDLLGPGTTLRVWDTAGLGEGDNGTVSNRKAIYQLFKLLRDLEGSVNLLVCCMRAPRLSRTAKNNWRLFHDIFQTSNNVPMVMAIIGLEDEDDMTAWWPQNKGAFTNDNIIPSGVAAVVAKKGKDNQWANEYAASRDRMRALIQAHALTQAIVIPPLVWYRKIWKSILSWFQSGFLVPTIEELQSSGITESEAKELRVILITTTSSDYYSYSTRNRIKYLYL
ncbi:hypothetical protein DXG01_002947 [Tephrocybe rancida]|nr:hypothetical protein DXG01_002947 [Tephrocybe rancida]